MMHRMHRPRRPTASAPSAGPAASLNSRRQFLAAVALAGADEAWAQAAALAPNAPAEVARVEGSAPALPAPGSRLALPALELLDGSRVEPAQFDGQVQELYWWASWCPFCAIVSPEIHKLWLAQRGRGLRVLTLSIDRRIEDAREYLLKRRYKIGRAHV